MRLKKIFNSSYINFGNWGWGVFMAIIVLLVSSYLTYFAFNRSIKQAEWVTHTIEVQKDIERILSAVKDAETGMRGYIITNDTAFLKPYYSAKDDTKNLLSSARKLLADNKEQLQNLQKLDSIIYLRYGYLDVLYNLQVDDTTNLESMYKVMLDGKAVMDSARALSNTMQETETKYYNERLRNSKTYYKSSRTIIIIFLAISILIILITFYLLVRSQREISEKEYKYRTIFHHSREIIFQLGKKFNLLEINPAARDILGYTEQELFTMHITDLFVSELAKAEFIHCINNKLEIINSETELRTKDGEIKIFILNLINKDNLNGIFIGTLHNITYRKKTEETRIMVENFANVGKISRIIAHEVRNPLTNIKLSIETLKHDSNAVAGNEYLEIIDKNADRINNLINQLLSSTKLSEFNFKKTSINDLVKETIELAADSARLKKIKIQAQYDDEICTVNVDAEKIKIALLNVIINAIEAMHQQNGQLLVTTKKDGDFCVIIIKDNGKGIPKQDIARIFQPFYTTKKNGTGLGLASTHHIILNHGGNITVESDPGKGTLFTITLLIN